MAFRSLWAGRLRAPAVRARQQRPNQALHPTGAVEVVSAGKRER